MKTTLELPDTAFRQAKAFAASQGVTLKQFFAEALEEKLKRCGRNKQSGRENGAPWMTGFGKLADLANENKHVLKAIDEEFETPDPEDIG